jgi:uncharacterized membrane protein YcaP (DUF421 family)
MATVLRVAFVYAFMLIALRVMGKREFGEMTPSDFLVLMFIPDIFQQALVGEDFSMTNAVVAVTTLLAIVFVMATLMYRFKKLEEIVSGGPAVLLAHGSVRERELASERITPEELMDALHEAGYDRTGQIRWAILEADGKISVIPKQPGRTVPRSDRHRAE